MKLYLAGPMTGLPNFNRPAFNAEATRLRALGWKVVNPAELDTTEPIADPDAPDAWGQYMRRDIPHLVRCHGIAMLPGWVESAGASLEFDIATRLHMPAFVAAAITQPPGHVLSHSPQELLLA